MNAIQNVFIADNVVSAFTSPATHPPLLGRVLLLRVQACCAERVRSIDTTAHAIGYTEATARKTFARRDCRLEAVGLDVTALVEKVAVGIHGVTTLVHDAAAADEI